AGLQHHAGRPRAYARRPGAADGAVGGRVRRACRSRYRQRPLIAEREPCEKSAGFRSERTLGEGGTCQYLVVAPPDPGYVRPYTGKEVVRELIDLWTREVTAG